MLKDVSSQKKASPKYVRKVEAIGVYGRFDFFIEDIKPGINIFHGENGSGKTTILHILANALNNDYQRFIHLPFNRIKIEFDNADILEISKPNKADMTLWRSDKRRRVKLFSLARETNNQAKEIETIKSKLQNNIDNEYDLLTLRFRNYEPLITAAYFPAFRTMIEAWYVLEQEIKRAEKINSSADITELTVYNSWQAKATHFARAIFGEFIPNLNYLSPFEIEKSLLNSFSKARQRLLSFNQEVLSKNFSEVFLAFLSKETNFNQERSDTILEDIKKLFEEIKAHPLQGDSSLTSEIYSKLQEIVYSVNKDDSLPEMFTTKILSIYRKSLQEIVDFQNKEFNAISKYIISVNNLLNDKKINIYWPSNEATNPLLEVVFVDGTSPGNLQFLSSGERQVFTLMYAIANMSSQQVVLIDEPEISIHIDTQSKLLKSICELLEHKQIIVCTHSPRIAGKQRDRLIEIKPTKTDISLWDKDNNAYKDLQDENNAYEIENENFEEEI